MTIWRASEDQLRDLVAKAKEKGGKDPQLCDNYLFASLYGQENGLYPRRAREKAEWAKQAGKGNWSRVVKRLSRREWIECCYPVKPKSAPMRLMKFNPAQRKCEVHRLRLERAQVLVRLVVNKARQQGISTWTVAEGVEDVLRDEQRRALMISDVDSRAELCLRMAHLARDFIGKKPGDPFDFKMASRATDTLVWGDPIRGSIKVTSAQKPAAGRGDTLDFLHINETAFWPNAKDRAVGVQDSLPDRLGTVAINESTANGDEGWYRDEFMQAWNKRHIPISERINMTWDAVFLAWFEDPDNCWSKTFGAGRALPEKAERQIRDSLDQEEEWLREQRFIKRWSQDDPWEHVQRLNVQGEKVWVWRRVNVGWVTVSYDQLAWRRQKIETYKSKGGVNTFNREHPSRPEVAFQATGGRVFDPQVMSEYSKQIREPLWRGDLIEPTGEQRVEVAELDTGWNEG